MDDSPVDLRTRSWPLLNAAALGDTARLKVLLDSGSVLGTKDDSGLTALHWAAIGPSQTAFPLWSRMAPILTRKTAMVSRPLFTQRGIPMRFGAC